MHPTEKHPNIKGKSWRTFRKLLTTTVIIGDFNTPLSTVDRCSKQNVNKDIVALNNALDQMDLTVIYIEPFIPKKQNTHSFQKHMEHFQDRAHDRVQKKSQQIQEN